MSLRKINIALYGIGILFMIIGILMKYMHIGGRMTFDIAGSMALFLSFSMSLYMNWNGHPLTRLCIMGCVVLFMGYLLKEFHVYWGRFFIITGLVVTGVTYLWIIALQLMAKEKPEAPKP